MKLCGPERWTFFSADVQTLSSMSRKGVSLGSKIALAAISVLLSLGVAELVTRAYFASFVGPQLYWYGTPWHRDQVSSKVDQAARDLSLVQVHENKVELEGISYTKYFPNEEKVVLGPGGVKRHPVRINSQGFRGPDFTEEKPRGRRRVLAVGASSTFGYRNLDHQTWPAQLQAILRERSGDDWEVINFAIPHANSAEILAMFRAEGARLAPDFVAIYSGANDATVVRKPDGISGRFVTWLEDHFVVALLATHLFPVLPGAESFIWSEELAQEREQAFVANNAALAESVEAVGGKLIVVTQQVQSLLVPTEGRRGLSYAEEVDRVEAALVERGVGPGSAERPALLDLEKVGKIYDWSRIMLIHDRLVAAQIAWAAGAGVPVADARRALDERRDLLLTWVHLHPDGNRLVAETVADVIFADSPPAQVEGASAGDTGPGGVSSSAG